MSTVIQPAASRRGILLISCAAALWGTVGIATQAIYSLSDLDATTVGFYRLAIGFPILAVLCRPIGGRGILLIRGRSLALLLLIGIMLGAYQVCFFASISHAGVATATLVTLCTAPVIVALLSALFLKEAFTRQTSWALALALAGTACLVGAPRQFDARGGLLIGIWLALGSATGYAIVTLLGRALAGRHHPLHATTISFGAGALALLPLAHPAAAFRTPEIWGLLLYVGIVPTAVSYTLFFLGMRYVRATAASVLTLVEPLTATLLAWLLFDERLGASGLVGAALLFGGIALLYRPNGVDVSQHPATDDV
ncbi:MAG TPA: DMT family transporter [Desulfuromonadales bacterium]|nr:DMT family transporter [Desulfuromonadales bacterium]